MVAMHNHKLRQSAFVVGHGSPAVCQSVGGEARWLARLVPARSHNRCRAPASGDQTPSALRAASEMHSLVRVAWAALPTQARGAAHTRSPSPHAVGLLAPMPLCRG